MQISEAWLREYVNPAISTEQLVEQLTMAGLEVDSVAPAAAVFSGVVVGEVVAMEQHPDADRLRVCQVAVGEAEPLQIVCGASNVRVGLRIPAALIGAVLPGDFKIKKSKLRGVESFGMLCSEKELGLAADANGLMELAVDAPVGVDIREYLSLNDNIIEVDLTPNRADCLSVEGIAREVAVLNKMDWSATQVEKSAVSHTNTLTVSVAATDACPRYLGRLIQGVNPKAETPLWMQERLRRSGVRSLSAIVDVTNYVLIELGQPLHAFDAAKLTGNIHVRYARINESVSLLNGQTIKLDNETLVIADDKQALALAGVMGGSESAVSDETQDVFLECAFFTPRSIAGKARNYGLHTDSSHRFERGVDPTLQERAIERATQLIIDMAGGSVGAIIEVTTASTLPQRTAVLLRKQRLEKTLGIALADDQVVDIFQRLGMTVQTQQDSWSVTPPGCRFDIAIEADLIEEIARIVGYNNLPNSSLLMRSELGKATEAVLELDRAKDLLVDRGYQEAITYSFVDEEIQQAIAPDDDVVRLKNPISADLSVMRTTLWCGLLKAALHNTNRQQNRVRFFETGLRFVNKDGNMQQQKMLSGLALGSAYSEQWGATSRKVDFFDIKADVQALFSLTGSDVQFFPAKHPALHPGQTAEILSQQGENIGWLGMLHPTLEKQLGFDTQVFLFELDQDLLLNKQIPKFKPLSKYPSVRRDMALIVKEEVAVSEIINCIKSCGIATLQDIVVFDIYRGKGVEEGSKSIALSLILQDFSQTLTDSEIDAIFSGLLETLTTKISAKLRD
ncbi:MAG: phenylalanine--tRNA ligase subunit beta [Methylobacter sp.]|jgi:phenylalanyl-tRNA synthetase beta chain|uniref:phenylalanine--tRNA ligase subunit beta n=1 Tax=Methylobacter sp. TaxID=2051955 RepID=UPI0025E2541A|nr:phenylalanine--tRNA ligase subunit beta [Methylobacter sp.]MCK9619224.1 phenylalanine--tRNA ligase subunit beta [Methylobacter sp.]